MRGNLFLRLMGMQDKEEEGYINKFFSGSIFLESDFYQVESIFPTPKIAKKVPPHLTLDACWQVSGRYPQLG